MAYHFFSRSPRAEREIALRRNHRLTISIDNTEKKVTCNARKNRVATALCSSGPVFQAGCGRSRNVVCSRVALRTRRGTNA